VHILILTFMKNVPLALSVVCLGTSFFLAGCSLFNTPPTNTENISQEVAVTEPVADTTTPVAPNDAPKPDTGVAVGEQTNLAPTDTPRGIADGGLYLPYTPTALAQASDNIVLFFYASWSPSSIATHKDITDNKDKMPKNLTILQVNFDDATAMRQQY
jgi:hypothetical protein